MTGHASSPATEPIRPRRPYWHLDAKWMVGLLLTMVIWGTLLSYALVHVTEQKRATEALTMGLALAFSPNGLDDERDFALVKAQLEAEGKERLDPFPGLPVSVTLDELKRLSPRELRLHIFEQLVTPLYAEGPDAILERISDPSEKAKMKQDLGPIGLVNRDTHDLVKRLFMWGCIISGLLAVLLFYFSYGFGRIGSLGLVLLIGSIPHALFFTLLETTVRESTSGSHPASADGGNMVSYLAAGVLPTLLSGLPRFYSQVVLSALLLILFAILASLIWPRVMRFIWQRRVKSRSV